MDRLALIRQLIGEYCRIPNDFSRSTTLESLGLDSYEIVDLVLSLEEKIGFASDDEDLLSLKSVRDIEDLISRCMKEENADHA